MCQLLLLFIGQSATMSSRKLSLRPDREVREAFGLFDRDGDGKITKQEVTGLIRSLEGDPACPHVQVEDNFRRKKNLTFLCKIWEKDGS